MSDKLRIQASTYRDIVSTFSINDKQYFDMWHIVSDKNECVTTNYPVKWWDWMKSARRIK